jgi:hypothetical protein
VKPVLSNVLPEVAAAIALSTQWHNITDKEMESTVSKINEALPAPESHQQIYRSTLRLLSSQLEGLDALQAQLELNRRNEAIRRRKIASMMEILPPSEVATLRTVLDILSQEKFEESPVAGPQLVCFYLESKGSFIKLPTGGLRLSYRGNRGGTYPSGHAITYQLPDYYGDEA